MSSDALMTDDHADLIARARSFASGCNPATRLVLRLAQALEDAPATQWEYTVRSTFVPLDRTYDCGPCDEETARVIAADSTEGFERTLLRRRKAGPWVEVG